MTKGSRDTFHWSSMATELGRVQIAYLDSCPAFLSLDPAPDFLDWLQNCGVASLIYDTLMPSALEQAARAAIDGGKPYEGLVHMVGRTAFQNEVLALTRSIPSGETRTYGELAALMGRPRAARAVGSALASNPLPLLIPCHRVVGSGLRLGQYSDGGAAMKRSLLKREGVDVVRLR